MYNFAANYERLGQFEQALGHYEQLVALARAHLSDRKWQTGVWLGGLGRCYTQASRFGEAEAALLEAAEVMNRSYDEPNVWSDSVFASLAEWYEALDDAATVNRGASTCPIHTMRMGAAENPPRKSRRTT